MLLIVIFNLILFLATVTAYDCTIKPLVIPVQNETIDTGTGQGLNRGIAVQFKPSTQKLSLRPSFIWNNTRIRNNVDCKGNPSEITACQGASGTTFTLYTEDFHSPTEKDWEARTLTTDPPPGGKKPNSGWTQAILDDGTEVELPVEIWSSSGMALEFTNKSFVSLGPKSSFVWNLLEASKAPSNFTGYDHGSRSFLKPADGEAVIGGLNHARVAGPFVNYTIAQYQMPIQCSLVVKVTSFIINNNKGSFPVVEPGKSVLACIDPMQNGFYLPDDLYRRWTDFTERPDAPRRTDYQTYPKELEGMLGSLHIVLEGGFNISIPHHELVSPDRRAILTDNGQYGVVENSSRIQAGVTSGKGDYGENYGILLGGIFLSSTYLFVDWDNGIFGLAPSQRINLTDPPLLQTVCSNNLTVLSLLKNTTRSAGGRSSSDKIALGTGIGFGLPTVLIAFLALFFHCHPRLLSRLTSRGRREGREEIIDSIPPASADVRENKGIAMGSPSWGRSREGSTTPGIMKIPSNTSVDEIV